MTEHLGFEPHGGPVSQQSNRRNGATRKVLKGNDGAVPIDIPRDRNGSFEPELIRKGQTRVAANEGARFWLSIKNNLKNRGVDDILIALFESVRSHGVHSNHCRAMDGLKGFPDAINAAYPDTTVQTCIVHLVRHSVTFCGWKDRKAVAKSLKQVYRAVDDGEATKALDGFEAERGQKHPSIAPSWRRAWQEVISFFAFPPAVRKIIYTTNAIESLNRVIRKTTKTRGSFPTDDARNQFAILYPERFNK